MESTRAIFNHEYGPMADAACSFCIICSHRLMLRTGGFYSLMGMGQNIIFGVMNIVNFCHGEMLMVGMYITYVLYTYFGVDPYVALPIVAVLMFGLGALIQSTLITPSLKTKSFTNLLFLTVGLGLLLTNGAGHLWFHLL